MVSKKSKSQSGRSERTQVARALLLRHPLSVHHFIIACLNVVLLCRCVLLVLDLESIGASETVPAQKTRYETVSRTTTAREWYGVLGAQVGLRRPILALKEI